MYRRLQVTLGLGILNLDLAQEVLNSCAKKCLKNGSLVFRWVMTLMSV